MANGEEFTNIFDTHRTDPEVVFPIPETGDDGYETGPMAISISLAGGGRLCDVYTGERWFGMLAHCPSRRKALGPIILYSGEFYISGPANHFTAAREFVETIPDAAWDNRLTDWLDTRFAQDDEE